MPKETRTKLNSKDIKCIFIDYCEEIKGCKLHNPINQYVIVNYDVEFDEYKNFNGEQWFQGWIIDQNTWFKIKK
jgi:hypothetical protein